MKGIFVIAAIFAIAFAQQDAVTLTEESDISPDGSFSHGFTSDNGISVEAAGDIYLTAVGNAKYTSPEGEEVSFSYVANGDVGFVPTGDHLPVAPEIPPQIARALEYIAAHPPTDPAEGAYVPDV